MRILAFSAYYEPEIVTSIHLSTELYEGLATKECIIDLFVPVPTRNISEDIRNKYKSIKLEQKCGGKLKIHRIPLVGENNNIIFRMLRYLLMNIKFIFKAIKCDADVIFVQSTPPTQGAMAAIIKKIKKVPFIYNLQDVFPDSMVSLNMIKKETILWKIGRAVENFTYHNADKIIVISDAIKRNILEKGVPEEKIIRIYNWVDTDNIFPVTKKENPLFSKLGLDRHEFYIVYAGNLGKAQNIDSLLEVAEKLQYNKEIKFLIFGQGSQEQTYKNIAEEKKLCNVQFFPILPFEQSHYVYSLGDLSLVTCRKEFGGIAMPSKIWSIMASGCPVLAWFDEKSDVEEIVTKEDIGFFAKSEDVNCLSEIIEYANCNRDKLKKMGIKARNLVERKYSRELAINNYYEVLLEVSLSL